MNDLPFISYSMSGSQVQLVLAIYDELRNNHNTAFDPGFSCDLKPFATFETNQVEDSGPFLKIINSRRFFHIGFFMLSYHVLVGRASSSDFTEFQTWGILDLNKDYGHILIKPETVLDKVHELIHPIELDFDDDPEFSKKFYVLAEDKTKADLYLSPGFRNLIKKIPIPEFIIEIFENRLIIGNKKIMALQSTIEFAEFLDKVSVIL
jgi:hypothetical protein